MMETPRLLSGRLLAALAALLLATSVAAEAQAQIRIAEADTLTGEDLVQLIAYENARKRGLDLELIVLKSDDVTFQAVLNGQVDIGVGVAYTQIQTLEAPIRHFYQVRRLGYFLVVDSTKYKSWADLDGGAIAVHARGSGTEALARLMEKVHGIEFSQITYVPGSEVRLVAMQRGTMAATFLDLTSTRILLESDPERFAALPIGDRSASDSVYYAKTAFLEQNAEAVQILCEELLKAARAVNADPTFAAAERERLGLLPDLPAEMVDDITPYHQQAVEAGLFPTDGGGAEAAKADFLFLAEAQGIKGDPETLAVEDFWTLAPLNAALKAVGDQ